jgi:FAD/FMN-containing dehydrogenase
VARALVGSESTCVTILEATLRLVPSPPARSLLVLGYAEAYTAGDHVPEIMQYGPIGLDGLDDRLISYMQKKGMRPEEVAMLPPGGGWLLVESGGEDKREADAKARRAMDSLKRQSHPPSMKLFDNPSEEKRI